jgi:hypothetical protein
MQRTKLPKLYAELLYDITKGVDDSAVPEVIERFVQLVKKRRPSDTFWHKITTSFYKLYQVREGIVEAHITLRSQPTKEEREEIIAFIQELYKDKKISIKEDEIYVLFVGIVVVPEVDTIMNAARKSFGWDINYTVMTEDELKFRKKNNDPFIWKFLKQPKIMLVGQEEELLR